MVLADLLDVEDERTSRRTISQAEVILSSRRGDLPRGFVEVLIGRAAPEDLMRYSARELAYLAESSWDYIQQREPGSARVRLYNPDSTGDLAGLGAISVLEILNDDMPFLLDSVMAEIGEHGSEVLLVAHPIVTVERKGGQLTAFLGQQPVEEAASRESLIHIHLSRVRDEDARTALVEGVESVLREVRLCVNDWKPMLGRVRDALKQLTDHPPPSLPPQEVAEAARFLEWLMADNFTFLGIREYTIASGEGEVEPLFESALGILRERDARVLRRGAGELGAMTPEIRAFLNEPKALIITKANIRSRVHRRVHMDYVGIKRFSSGGGLSGELRIVGLFTSTAYTQSARSIPYIGGKIDAVLKRAAFSEDSHSGKSLVNVLESYPRDDLFQIDEDTLFAFALAIMQLDERPRVRVLARRDRFDRFVSVLIYVPRDRFESHVRAAIGEFLARAFNGRVSAFQPSFTEGPLVRVHFIIGRNQGEAPNPSRAALEEEVAAMVRTWGDDLDDAIALAYSPERAGALQAKYRNAFSHGYREVYSPAIAVGDIRVIENLSPESPVDASFYRRLGEPASSASLKIWSRGRPIPLSERVPALENMGFNVVEERTDRIELAGGLEDEIWFHDMLLERDDGSEIDLDTLRPRLEASFKAVLTGEAENDGFNMLVLAAGLPWRDVVMIRALGRFLRQARIAYSQDYLWRALRRHPDVAQQLTSLVHAKFDVRLGLTAEARAEQQAQILARIEEALRAVDSLDDDVILRRFTNAVNAAVRTNFFQSDESGRPKPTIAIKFDSRKLDDLPAPRPLYEVFVYSPRVEGIHLRYGKVARGGIRWSDRAQDFRTEILGLVKAQQVKNAVIVPVGAKGGFVPKHLTSGMTRDALQAEGVAAYKLFISSLLDITDNLGVEGTIPPRDVIRHDGDDPYLVVAADKGTATFSDIANALAIEHGFWLGDAFASGGSAGYDHKGMGITARGAWEAVKRHFREMNVDIGVTPFTVAGVGDMSGDVFGNGMLRERTIKLVAAFDHRDIFIDPDPDPERSFAERARLFALPRSSWQDYDKSLISAGGGVSSRSAKEIVLSSAAQSLLGLPSAKATPYEVMRAILQMPVDLLWFGGIGTYVRASAESDDSVGDRANDPIRTTGAQLKCKVIGEGANLGMTQRGRIEAAERGIRLNTDAIDNSAGVNTSDLEVNIKIAFEMPLRTGAVSLEARNALLAAMTDEVAALVLRNNYLQTLAISLAARRGVEELGFQQRLMQILEARGELDRRIEFLPDNTEIAERRQHGKPLTRPEIAVLLAYSKLSLYSELLESSVPDDDYLGQELVRYFPSRLQQEFPSALQEHRLRREIIATQLANSMINRGGPTLIVRMADKTGASSERIALAFAVVRNSYRMTELNSAIDGLDGRIDGATQLSLYAEVQSVLLDRVVWFLRHADLARGVGALIEHYGKGIRQVGAILDRVMLPDDRRSNEARFQKLVAAGVPDDVARSIADLFDLAAAPDIILVADRSERSIADVAATYFAAGGVFALDRIREPARRIKISDYFDQLALDQALDSLAETERRMAAQMVAEGAAGPAAVEAWVAKQPDEVRRIRVALDEIERSGISLSKLSVAASLVGSLVRQ